MGRAPPYSSFFFVLAQIPASRGAGVAIFGRRCGKRVETCATLARKRPIRGAGPQGKITPAPNTPYTCGSVPALRPAQGLARKVAGRGECSYRSKSWTGTSVFGRFCSYGSKTWTHTSTLTAARPSSRACPAISRFVSGRILPNSRTGMCILCATLRVMVNGPRITATRSQQYRFYASTTGVNVRLFGGMDATQGGGLGVAPSRPLGGSAKRGG